MLPAANEHSRGDSLGILGEQRGAAPSLVVCDQQLTDDIPIKNHFPSTTIQNMLKIRIHWDLICIRPATYNEVQQIMVIHWTISDQ